MALDLSGRDAPGRIEGEPSMWWIRSAVEGVTQPGIVKRPVQTLPSSRLVFSSSNGRSPVRSAKRTTPLDQTSACLPT